MNNKIINHGILSKINLHLTRCYPRPFEKIAVKGKDLIGVEIGVLAGEHALSMLKKLSIKKIYLIDPYEDYDGYNIGEELDEGNLAGLLLAEEKAEEKLKKFEDKVVWVKKYSEKAVNDVPDDLDFIYIDAAHDYESVKKDIENYYPKVKVGGIIGGHDIDNGICPSHEELTKAVLEFVNKYNLTLFVGANDWWVVKEK